VTLRQLLNLKTRSTDEYREAFSRVDLDDSGYIEVSEVKKLLEEVYGEDDVPNFEVSTFVTLFDTDRDGKISWDEFANALGANESASSPSNPMLPESAESVPGPTLSGTVTVTLDDGTEVAMDANAYMDELKAEAQALRAELTQSEAQEAASQTAISNSISAYVMSLPEDQLKLLTNGISDDVVDAMKQIVKYILKAPSGDGELGKEETVTMEQTKLQTLCMYQLSLGYKLREAEATGEANDAVGN